MTIVESVGKTKLILDSIDWLLMPQKLISDEGPRIPIHQSDQTVMSATTTMISRIIPNLMPIPPLHQTRSRWRPRMTYLTTDRTCCLWNSKAIPTQATPDRGAWFRPTPLTLGPCPPTLPKRHMYPLLWPPWAWPPLKNFLKEEAPPLEVRCPEKIYLNIISKSAILPSPIVRPRPTRQARPIQIRKIVTDLQRILLPQTENNNDEFCS